MTVLTTPALFFFNDTATTEIYTLSLHDALPILEVLVAQPRDHHPPDAVAGHGGEHAGADAPAGLGGGLAGHARSEEHTSELQSLAYLVCRLLLEKKKQNLRSAATCPPRVRDTNT